MGNQSVVLKIIRLMLHSINYKRLCLCCFFSLFLVFTVEATEYIVRPAPNDENGVSIAGEKTTLVEDIEISYWQYLLWIGTMYVVSAIDMLRPIRFIFAIVGCCALDNPGLSRVYSYIKTKPGAYITEIVAEVGLGRGTVKRSVHVLRVLKKIYAYKDGGKIRYFDANVTYSEEEKRIISVLQNANNKRIISEIQNGNCNTNIDLAREFGVSRATISWYVKNLKEIGLIEETKIGRNITYRINNSYNSLFSCIDEK